MVYDTEKAVTFAKKAKSLGKAMIMGIMPLKSQKLLPVQLSPPAPLILTRHCKWNSVPHPPQLFFIKINTT